jgi:hypothetical protein
MTRAVSKTVVAARTILLPMTQMIQITTNTGLPKKTKRAKRHPSTLHRHQSIMNSPARSDMPTVLTPTIDSKMNLMIMEMVAIHFRE